MDVLLDCLRRGLQDPILLVDVTLLRIIHQQMADDTGGKLSNAQNGMHPPLKKKKKSILSTQSQQTTGTKTVVHV